jgi:UDP-2-acetamido-2,6-beta-L-arabino-hexul-4-ose reductase
MKILVTGAKGFIGKNLCLTLKNAGHEVFEYDLGSTNDDLKTYVSKVDWIIHLAGINRPLKPEEFIDGNVNFTKKTFGRGSSGWVQSPHHLFVKYSSRSRQPLWPK